MNKLHPSVEQLKPLVHDSTSLELLIELQTILNCVREAELKLAAAQHDYIQFITIKLMPHVENS